MDCIVGSADLWGAITAFQDGIFEDLLPFLAIDPSRDLSARLEWLDPLLGRWYLRPDVVARRWEFVDQRLPWLRSHVAYHAAVRGLVDRLDSVLVQGPIEDPECVVHLALEYGHIDILRYLHTAFGNSAPWFSPHTMTIAAAAGRLSLVRFVHDVVNCGATIDAMDLAAAFGHLDVVQCLHSYRREGCSSAAMDLAAANGHLAVVRYLHEHRTEGCTTDAMDHAASNGHVDVVKFLHCNRCEGCTSGAIDAAVMHGHDDVALFLLRHRSEGGSRKALAAASLRRNDAMLQALMAHQKGHPKCISNYWSTMMMLCRRAFGIGLRSCSTLPPVAPPAKNFGDFNTLAAEIRAIAKTQAKSKKLEMPDTQLLKAMERTDLIHAIRKKHGGFVAVAQKLSLPIATNAKGIEVHKKLAVRQKRRRARLIDLQKHNVF
ncbi:hypothetical protein ACHHYP_10317 [Achlya hypogyna]|uniref:Uncharacterized protein n=1 Tax=Achlya hypogyna TaxID=1202772 RepID=A0A1V9YLS3_ACHHY|nr:hypothetical protein ACHHYP_10317 [Achlya hypogyna]